MPTIFRSVTEGNVVKDFYNELNKSTQESCGENVVYMK